MGNTRGVTHFVGLNLRRNAYQGKALIVLLCIALFLQAYFGKVRGALAIQNEAIGLGELFMAISNNNYTAFTLWAGFILLISDLPDKSEGLFPFLLRGSKLSWLLGQVLYLLLLTLLYLLFLLLVEAMLLVPYMRMGTGWSPAFFKMLNAPYSYGIQGRFVLPVSALRGQQPIILTAKCVALFLLAGISTGMLTMALQLLWARGPGILTGGLLLVLDFLVTTVFVSRQDLLYFSPLSLARIGNLSVSAWNRLLPGFGYACLLHSGLIVLSFMIQLYSLRRLEV